jgi:5-(carboxyamino)imidazole ribonucleotide synthase
MILPGATLGLLGGGQLGRMFASEAVRLGYRVVVVDPTGEAPAAAHATRHLARPWNDPDALQELVESSDAITTEFENVPADALRALAAHRPVRPSADAVATCQDRIVEKRFLNAAGVATVRWAPVAAPADFGTALEAIGGGPGLLKTARLGYDGKGQAPVGDGAQLAAAFVALGGVPCILEERVALASEISVMVARGADGAVVHWPVGENVHVNGILHTTVVPARVPEPTRIAAAATATTIAGALEYVGVLGVECFLTEGGQLLVNELAPRPHNSGHWTLDASVTSQFEQQVRTLTGLPLGDTALLRPAAMVNLLGDLWRDGPPQWHRALAMPGVRLHLYGKPEPRPGRKMGHLTALAARPTDALELALAAWRALSD